MLETEHYKVVIIGAGVSGLSAARKLEANISSLQILEARFQIGGRIHSLSTTIKNKSLIIEDGAAWIHGTTNNPLCKYLDKNSILPIFDKNPWTKPNYRDVAIIYNRRRTDHVHDLIQQYEDDLKVVQELAVTNKVFDSNEYSLEYALRTVTKHHHLNNNIIIEGLFVHMIECWHANPISTIPLSELSREDGDLEGPHCRVKNGMQSMLQPLAINLQNRISFNEEVLSVHYNNNNIVIITSSGRKIKADYVISTLSIGCLQKAIHFDMFQPPLSSVKQEAISSMSMGVYKKVFLSFEDIFWKVQEPMIGLINHPPSSVLGKYLLVHNLWIEQNLPCLEVLLVGKSGKWSVGKSDEVIITEVLDFIRRSFDNVSKIVTYHISRWEEDRYTLGSYSGYVLGTNDNHIHDLQSSEWDNRLWFAGEALSELYEGSVHGALFSGEDVAEKVMEFMEM